MRGAAKRGRLGFAAALVSISIVVAVIAGLVLDGGTSSGLHAQPASARTYAVLSLETPHVASTYPTYRLAPGQEGPGPAVSQAQTTQAAFERPIATYIRYSEGRLAAAGQQTRLLQAALRAGSRSEAQQRWRAAYSDYLQLGGVYLTGSLSELNDRIDGTAGGIPGGVGSDKFTGLHRIEYGLWTGAPPASLSSYAGRLQSDLAAMAKLLPHARPTATEYGTRAHEILEDALRDQLSGTAVPWSGEGVLGTEAGLTATEHVIASLHELLHDEDGEHPPVGPIVEAELNTLRAAVSSIAAAHGGVLPADAGLTRGQTDELQGALGGALEALSQVPPALEAEPAPKPIVIPKKDERIDG